MTPEQFIDWFNGFLDSALLEKDTLSVAEMELVCNVLEGVCSPKQGSTSPNINFPPSLPYKEWDTGGTNNLCPYPYECGMPMTWHGIIPPTCNKCGKIGQIGTIT